MFLTFGITKQNDWVSISDVQSGATELRCPFCRQKGLIAKKGEHKEHHFAHSGKTCRESEEAIKQSLLPTIDRFELLDSDESKYIDRRGSYKHDRIFFWKGIDDAVDRLEVMDILTVERKHNKRLQKAVENLQKLDGYVDEYGDPTPKLTALLDALAPIENLRDEFRRDVTETKINRHYHSNKLRKQDTIKQFDKAQRYWLDAFYRRQARYYPECLELLNQKLNALNEQSLYVFCIGVRCDSRCSSILKIGMTTRAPAERLKEVVAMLQPIYDEITSAEVIAVLPGGGRLERLLHQHYHKYLLPISNHREFFNAELRTKLVEEIEDLGHVEPYEPPALAQPVVPDVPAPGRKKKSSEEIIREYPDIVICLRDQMGIRETARKTGRSVNTVQKVKKAMT